MAHDPFVPEELAGSIGAVLRHGRPAATAWALSDEYLITAADALGPAPPQEDELEVRFLEGTCRVRVREWRPKDLDLAILKLPKEAVGKYRPLSLSRLDKPSGGVYLTGFDRDLHLVNDVVVVGPAARRGMRETVIEFTGPRGPAVLPGAPVLTPERHAFGLSSGVVLPAGARVLTLNRLLPHSEILRHHVYTQTPQAVEEVTESLPEAALPPPEPPVEGGEGGGPEPGREPESHGEATAAAEAGPEAAPPLRYPHAAFFQVGPGGAAAEVADHLRLAPPPEGARLEFRFGFGPQVKGIRQHGQPPGLVPPARLPFPIRLRVDVWSEDFEFDRPTDEVTVPASGPSPEAAYTLRPVKPPGPERRAALFVFVRHETHLIAAFRVEAAVAAAPGEAAAPQGLEYLYLDHLWFRFARRALAAPAVTIYLRTEGERVQVFAFTRDQPTWGGVGVLVPEFQEKTRQIYLHITKLASRLQSGGGLPFGAEAKGLSELGYQLFSDLFFSRPRQPELRAFADYVRQLPPGAEVTVATEARGRAFLLPWGLVYDGPLPQAASGGQKKDGFWGHRFKLTVRPSRQSAAPAETPAVPPRLATIYENHVQAAAMARFVADLAARRKVRGPEELPIQDFSVPRLATDPFELLHCFCHGHTELPDKALAEALSSPTGPATGLMGAGDNTRGSYLYTQRGTATLARLQEKVEQLPGSPVVLLSMCDSAQVSSSGRSFVTFFLEAGARAVVGTEGPNPWDLAYRMDTAILSRLLGGSDTALREAVWEARRTEIEGNVLALIYTVYGDGQATLAAAPPAAQDENQE